MQNQVSTSACPDCDESTRRDFLKAAALGGLGVAAATLVPSVRASSCEPLVAVLYKSLSEEQKKVVTFDFNHPLRSKVDNNWHITPVRIGKFFTSDQQEMVKQIFVSVHNPEYVDKVMAHVQEDAGGLGNYSIALFGQPGSGAFEFVLTGRHCTMRCDGDSVEGAAFGGPIFYGHASQGFYEKPDHPGNVYWYQAKRANEVFNALDGKQRALALLGDPREEQATNTVALRKKSQKLAGLRVSEMSRDQRELVQKVLAALLLPFRKQDTDEVMRYVKKNGGVSSLAMSFYKNLDVGNDRVWDVWQLESPNMVWYFRGHPHVHVWANVQA